MRLRLAFLIATAAALALQPARAADAPPAVAPSTAAQAAVDNGPLKAEKEDTASEASGLELIRGAIARRPGVASIEAMKDWLTQVVIRCQQFLQENRESRRVRAVLAVEAQYRIELAALTDDHAERDRAVKTARDLLLKIKNDDMALQARLVLLQAAWPEDMTEAAKQAKIIMEDFTGQSQSAAALWTMMRLHQRRGEDQPMRNTALELFSSFPSAPESLQARMMLKQLGLLNQAIPAVKLMSADGQAFDLGALRGQAIVLDFWTAGTLAQTAALEGATDLRRLHDALNGRGLIVLGVNLDTDRETFEKARAARPTPWPQIWAGTPPNQLLAQSCAVETPPTRILVDPYGLVCRLALHPAELDGLIKRWQTGRMLAGTATPEPPAPAAKTVAKKPEPPAKTTVKVAAAKPAPKPTPKPVAKPAAKPVAKPAAQPKPVVAQTEPEPRMTFRQKVAAGFAAAMKEAQSPVFGRKDDDDQPVKKSGPLADLRTKSPDRPARQSGPLADLRTKPGGGADLRSKPPEAEAPPSAPPPPPTAAQARAAAAAAAATHQEIGGAVYAKPLPSSPPPMREVQPEPPAAAAAPAAPPPAPEPELPKKVFVTAALAKEAAQKEPPALPSAPPPPPARTSTKPPSGYRSAAEKTGQSPRVEPAPAKIKPSSGYGTASASPKPSPRSSPAEAKPKPSLVFGSTG